MKQKIKYQVINYTKKNHYFRILVRKLLFMKNRLKYLFCLRKTQANLILFESYNGKSYADSPKFIYEYMLKQERFKDYQFVWVLKDIDKHKFNERTIVVKKNSIKYLKYYSKAKYWVVNSLVPEYIFKKKNQIYIQTWHGTPLKKLRYDIEVEGNVLNTIKEIRKRNDIDVKKIDYFLSPSKFATEKFTSAFNLKALKKENIIVEKGYPRNATLLTYKEKDIVKIKKMLGLPSDKKVILYAPTFRDNQHTSGCGYTYSLALDFDKLHKEIGNEYVILFRTHYFISNQFDFQKYKGFIYDVSNYDELNDLYVISDILLTDYSSVFFDYALLEKPMIFYMYDLDDYEHNLRGFYFDIHTLPGPIVKEEKDVIKAIKNSEQDKLLYQDKYIKFNQTYNYLNTEKATRDVVEYIFK